MLVYCTAYHYWPGTIGSAIGFVATVAAGLMLRSSSTANACPPIRSIGGPYGNGPYRKAKCTPNRQIVAMLAEIAGKLREQSCKNHAKRALNWQAFEDDLAEAAALAEKEDHAGSIRQYSAAIRRIMTQCREQGRTTEAAADSF